MRAKISEDDMKHVQRLREAVKEEITPYYDTDFNLLRWLKGHNYNFDVILPKLLNHLRFRKSRWNLDSIADQQRNHPVHRHWKAGLTGPAVRTPNAIVNVEQTGTNDYWGMLLTHPINEILKARIFDLETMLRRVLQMEKETGEQASILYFMDLNEVKYDRRLITLMTGALSAISSFMSEHYVELIHTFILVNAPSFISTLWSIAKPLLPERTRNKVKIFGSNWRKDVLEIAVPDVLPSFWNEPGSTTFKADIQRSLPFSPEGYYKGTLPDIAESLSIPAGKTGLVKVVAKQGSIIRWMLHADGHFGYSLFLTDDEENTDIRMMKSVYPLFSKIPGPTLVPLQDEIQCEYSGVYKFWFTNEHAWLHTLKIQHVITVEAP